MAHKLSKVWTYAVIFALLLPLVLAEAPKWHPIHVDSSHAVTIVVIVRIGLYFMPIVLLGIVCLFFPRSVYEFQRQELLWRKKIPLLGRLAWQEMPEDAPIGSVWSCRIIGMSLIALVFILLWTMLSPSQ